MTYSAGNIIATTDYNGFVANNVENINRWWGTGTGDAGWGQTALGTLSGHPTVTAAQWAGIVDSMRLAAYHTDSTITNQTTPTTGTRVTALSNISTDIATIYTNRGNASSMGSVNYSWSGTASVTAATGTGTQSWRMTWTSTVTFGSSDQARYFFNAGGLIKIAMSKTSIGTTKDTYWNSLVSGAGTIYISGGINGTQTISGSSYTGVTVRSNSEPYTSNTSAGWYYLLANGSTQIFQATQTTVPYTGDSITVTASVSGSVLTITTVWNSDNSVSGTADNSVSGGTATGSPFSVFGTAPAVVVSTIYPSTSYLSNTWGTTAIAESVVVETFNVLSPYWINSLNGVPDYFFYTERSLSSVIDSSGNVYEVATGYGQLSLGGGNTTAISKYNSGGELQWTIGLRSNTGSSGPQCIISEMVLDSTEGYLYLAGESAFDSSGSTGGIIIKLNTSTKAIEWQKCYSTGISEISVTSSYIYVTSTFLDTAISNVSSVILQLDINGNLNWARTLRNPAGPTSQTLNSAIDSSNNVYVVGFGAPASDGAYQALIAKYNSAGTLQWKRALYPDGFLYSNRLAGICVDSSGNAYVNGNMYDPSATSGYTSMFAKYNSSGGLVWQKSLPTNNSNSWGYGATGGNSIMLAPDESSVYATGTADATGSSNLVGFMVNLTTAGTMSWSKSVTTTFGYNTWLTGIDVNPAGTIIAAAGAAQNASYVPRCMVLKLPANGSSVGTYGDYILGSSGLALSTSSYTDTEASYFVSADVTSSITLRSSSAIVASNVTLTSTRTSVS